MDLTSFALERRTVAGTLIVLLIFAGLSAYLSSPRQMDPGFVVRTAFIQTQFPGASPERVEQLITDPIEKAVQEIPELDFVSSESSTGLSVVYVNIREEFKVMRPIWDKLRRKIDGIRGDLPEGIQGPNINDEFGDVYPIMYSLTSDGFSYMELKETADEIRDELLRIKGVAKVEIIGAQEERLFVEYNNAALAQVGLSPVALQQTLAARNIIQPGGEIDVANETIALEPSGNFGSVAELGRTMVRSPKNGELIYLEDITKIYRGYIDPPEGMVRVEGTPGLTLAISMAEGNNLIELGEHVDALFVTLPAIYPIGLDFFRTYYQPTAVEAKVADFASNVFQAVLIVLVVMLLTLGLRTGLVVAALIPATMMITFFFMGLFEIQIDQMSLASLIIALGLLVDNAIVVSESIMVRMAAGEKPVKAALAATSELKVPLLIASLTTCAAFLPIRLAESAVGEYTGVLFSVVSITLLCSWGLALTMIPLLCINFLKPKAEDQTFDSKFYKGYRSLILGVLRNRWLSIGLATAGFFLGIQLYRFVPQIFFPDQGTDFFLAGFSLPQGTSIETTQKMTADIDNFIATELRSSTNDEGESTDGIDTWTTYIGVTPPRFTLGYNPGAAKPGFSDYLIRANNANAVPELMRKLEAYAVERYPDVQPDIRLLGNGPPVTKPIEVRLSGKDTERLFEVVDDVKQWLAERKGTRFIEDDWGPRVKKFLIDIDENRARRANLSNQDVAISLQTFLSGFETTRYREDDKTIPVLLRSEAQGRRNIDRLDSLDVFGQTAETSVPLDQVADVELQWEISEIKRRGRSRTVTISSELVEGLTAAEVNAEFVPWLEEQQKEWGVGYRYELGGEKEGSEKANQSIADKLPIAGLFIVMLLVWQFNSIKKPLIVLTTILLALVGVAIGLIVMRSYFGFMTLLGIVSLAGIVINNGIVLIDRIDLEREENGLSPAHAIIQAAQQRFRPILLTTATTVASLIPLYASGEAMWQPMAVAIMFGLVFATILTLGFVPLMYSILFKVDFSDYHYDAYRA